MYKVINLYLTNKEILLYDVDDWSNLRKEHRIVGEIVGNSLHVSSLPVKISPEETCLLIEKKIVTVLESPKEITYFEEENTIMKEYENELLDAQTKVYKKIRRDQLETLADQIKSKRNTNKTKEEIIIEELEKLPCGTKNNMIWPTKLSAKSNLYKNLKSVNLEEILKLTTPLKAAVYSDLWNKGYYITQGGKFGGDFLAYAGDPVCHHALFIVKCKDGEDRIFPSDLISFGRLGTSVKKKSVWASLQNSEVLYITMNWIDA